MPWSFVAHLLLVLLVPLVLFGGVSRWGKRIPPRRSPLDQEAELSLLPSFLGGFVVAFPTLAILLALPPGEGYGTYLRLAAVEELGKAVVPMLLVRFRGTVSIRKTILLFVASGLGFSLFENILFLVKDPGLSLLRSFTSVPLHASLSAIFGFAYGYSRYQYRARTLWGGAAAVLLHGIYNAGWEYSLGIPIGGVPISILVLSIGIDGVLWHTARKLEEA